MKGLPDVHEPTLRRSVATVAHAYNGVPYESGAFAFMHPARIAAIARLRGLVAADPGRARVLEIGCALGQNLLPLTVAYPNARFVGVDVSPAQIARAQAAADALGLHNVEFRAADIADPKLDPGGPFDVILCHGVYSWVPQGVRDAILRRCAEWLAPSGLALVSFNVLPGAQVLLRVRELAHALSPIDGEPLDRVDTAKNRFRALCANSGETIDGAIRHALETFIDADAPYLAHEHFAAVNEPCSVAVFAGHAARYGLRLVSDAVLSDEGGRESLARHLGGDMTGIEREAVVDLLAGTAFRQALLCRADRPCAGDWQIEAMASMAVAPSLDAEAAVLSGHVNAMRVTHGGSEVQLRLPAACGAVQTVFNAAPRYLAVAELLADRPPGERRIILHSLLRLALVGAIDLASEPLPIAATLSDQPRAWSWARYCAEAGSAWFCGLRHQSERLTPEVRQLLLWVDGETPLDRVRQRWLDWSRAQPPEPLVADAAGRASPPPPEGRFSNLLERLQAIGAVL